MNKRKVKDHIAGYLFITPSSIMLSMMVIFPIVMVFYYSFTDYTGGKDYHFVGMKNYLRMFNDPAMTYALKNTAIFVVFIVPLTVLVSLFLAGILTMHFQNRFGSFVRSALFVPVVCSASVIGVIWFYLFSSDKDGMINAFIQVFGAGPVKWLGRTNTAMFVIIFVTIWKSVGYFMVIFYAAMMEVPQTYLEAAQIDGATKRQQFFHIILPNIRSTTSFVVTINCIWSFQIFDLAYTMTHGGPGYGTTTLIYRVYQEGFWTWKMGYACAISVMLFLMIMVVSWIVRRFFPVNAGD